MYWSTIQASDRDVIRLVLLSSIIFFALQTLGNYKSHLCMLYFFLCVARLTMLHIFWSLIY